MSNSDIDYIEAELRATTSSGSKTNPWPPTKGHWANAYSRLESLRSAPPPPPPPPVPSGSIMFDGRASRMTALDSYQQSAGGTPPPNVVNSYGSFYTLQIPKLWDCACFGFGSGHNFKLVPDDHYGWVYEVTTRIGDTNQWGGNTGGTINGAAELSKERILGNDVWAWFAIGVQIPAWNGPASNIFFCDLASFGYQTSENDQVGFGLLADSNGKLCYSVAENSGYVNAPPGVWTPGTVNYNKPLLPVTLGQRDQFVVGVKAATDNSGEAQLWHRPQGGTWTMEYDFHGATELYGVTPDGKKFSPDLTGFVALDKIGLYYGNHDQSVNQQTVKETGLVVASDLATAQATLPT